MADQRNGWEVVYQGPELESGSAGGYYRPMVTLTEEAYRKCRELCQRSGRNEVGWFGTLRLVGSQVLVEEIYLIDQEVGFATTDITGLTKLGSRLLKEGKTDELNHLHAWFHCHPGDGVSPSGQDEETYRELCKSSDTILMMIFSKDAKRAYARFRFHGWDIPMTWRVVAQQTNYFPDFDEKVKEGRRYVSTFHGEQGAWGFGPPQQEFRGGERQWRDGHGYVVVGKRPEEKGEEARVSATPRAPKGPLTKQDIANFNHQLREAGYAEEVVKNVISRAIAKFGRAEENKEENKEPVVGEGKPLLPTLADEKDEKRAPSLLILDDEGPGGAKNPGAKSGDDEYEIGAGYYGKNTGDAWGS